MAVRYPAPAMTVRAKPIAVSHAPAAAAPASVVAVTLAKITKNINRAVYTLDSM